jgi:hypothetical protein
MTNFLIEHGLLVASFLSILGGLVLLLAYRVDRIFHWIAMRIMAVAARRPPDFIVGGVDDPYLLRWYLTPWRTWYNRIPEDEQNLWHKFVNRCLPNIYLHFFMRDDDDRALHDHPWPWISVLLRGSYIEHTIAQGGIHRRTLREAPSIKISGPRRAHRVELLPWFLGLPDVDRRGVSGSVPCWTLFITGPRVRTWGFHCPERGWVHFKDFTDPSDIGKTGRGCDAPAQERVP